MRMLFNLAVFPGIFLLYKVYKLDKIEKEPIGLILKLLVGGILTIPFAAGAESLFGGILEELFDVESLAFIFLENYLVVALAEEGFKKIALKLFSWKNKEFNYTFDGIVYAVSVSMGFAIVENIMYVFDDGITTALLRMVTAVPAHAIFAIFMGFYYGLAKKAEPHTRVTMVESEEGITEVPEQIGDRKLMKRYKRLALWVPVFLHGTYDFCASLGTVASFIAFVVFVVVLDIVALKKIKKSSADDTAI